ncbi:MAG TPA: hypothetical protein PLQ76_09530, partial [bacterium]|nr:hypothetical protein [bacterium]
MRIIKNRPPAGKSAPRDFDGRIFLAPRIALFAGAAVWVAAYYGMMDETLVIAKERLILSTIPLLLWFSLYTFGAVAVAGSYPERKRAIFQGAIAFDIVFVSLLIYSTGNAQSNFYLAFYPFIAMEVFLFGFAAGAVVTVLSGAAYAAIYFMTGSEQLFLGDFLLRLGFMFLVFIVIASLEENERRARLDIERQNKKIDELNERIELKYQELVDDREALGQTMAEKEFLLNKINIDIERRHLQINYSRELNAQNDIERAVTLFSRYGKDLLDVERVDVITASPEQRLAYLYPSDPDEAAQDMPF